MKTEVIIVAAGRGTRMQARLPKQFLKISGKTVLEWSLRAFLNVHGIKKLILVLPQLYTRRYSKYISPDIRKKVVLVEGGKRRIDSVKAGYRYVSPDCEIVLIHDAVRPLIRESDIKKCIAECKKHGAAIAAAPCADTVKQARADGCVHKTLDRSCIWLIQTPQVFKKKYLDNALNKKNIPDVTDDAQLIERMGKKVKLVDVGAYNRKITYPADLVWAENYLKSYKL